MSRHLPRCQPFLVHFWAQSLTCLGDAHQSEDRAEDQASLLTLTAPHAAKRQGRCQVRCFNPGKCCGELCLLYILMDIVFPFMHQSNETHA